MAPMSTDAAEARKRRKEIILSQRAEGESTAECAAAATSKASAAAAAAAATSISDTTSKTATSNSAKVPVGKGSSATEKKPPKKRKVADDPSSAKDKASRSAAEAEAEAEASEDDYSDGEFDRKKAQIRYDPDVPMSKEQLASWRREARRVRNRESAAASRQRIRNRISELEDEVGQWKSKYAHAIQRLEALEEAIANKQEGASAGLESKASVGV